MRIKKKKAREQNENERGQKKLPLIDILIVFFFPGVANFILCPIILLWQILYSFYNYAEMIKREPGFFGTRAWSQFGSIYLRHFNELDHEFVTRLSRGYKGKIFRLIVASRPC